MKLYDVEVSGNCYKVRLLCSLLGLPCERVEVDYRGGAHKKPGFLKLNPLGQVPVLVDGDVVVRDSQAILVYLAAKANRSDWLPLQPVAMAEVMQWLSTAANDLARGPMDARAAVKFGRQINVEAAQTKARQIIGIVDVHLRDREWLACGRATVADVACFPYIALAPEGGVSLEACASVNAWIARVKQLPGFISMPGVG